MKCWGCGFEATADGWSHCQRCGRLTLRNVVEVCMGIASMAARLEVWSATSRTGRNAAERVFKARMGDSPTKVYPTRHGAARAAFASAWSKSLRDVVECDPRTGRFVMLATPPSGRGWFAGDRARVFPDGPIEVGPAFTGRPIDFSAIDELADAEAFGAEIEAFTGRATISLDVGAGEDLAVGQLVAVNAEGKAVAAEEAKAIGTVTGKRLGVTGGERGEVVRVAMKRHGPSFDRGALFDLPDPPSFRWTHELSTTPIRTSGVDMPTVARTLEERKRFADAVLRWAGANLDDEELSRHAQACHAEREGRFAVQSPIFGQLVGDARDAGSVLDLVRRGRDRARRGQVTVRGFDAEVCRLWAKSLGDGSLDNHLRSVSAAPTHVQWTVKHCTEGRAEWTEGNAIDVALILDGEKRLRARERTEEAGGGTTVINVAPAFGAGAEIRRRAREIAERVTRKHEETVAAACATPEEIRRGRCLHAPEARCERCAGRYPVEEAPTEPRSMNFDGAQLIVDQWEHETGGRFIALDESAGSLFGAPYFEIRISTKRALRSTCAGIRRAARSLGVPDRVGRAMGEIADVLTRRSAEP